MTRRSVFLGRQLQWATSSCDVRKALARCPLPEGDIFADCAARPDTQTSGKAPVESWPRSSWRSLSLRLDVELSTPSQPDDLADLDDVDGTDNTASFQGRISSRARRRPVALECRRGRQD